MPPAIVEVWRLHIEAEKWGFEHISSNDKKNHLSKNINQIFNCLVFIFCSCDTEIW